MPIRPALRMEQRDTCRTDFHEITYLGISATIRRYIRISGCERTKSRHFIQDHNRMDSYRVSMAGVPISTIASGEGDPYILYVY
jgi:hypothetical protein